MPGSSPHPQGLAALRTNAVFRARNLGKVYRMGEVDVPALRDDGN